MNRLQRFIQVTKMHIRLYKEINTKYTGKQREINLCNNKYMYKKKLKKIITNRWK